MAGVIKRASIPPGPGVRESERPTVRPTRHASVQRRSPMPEPGSDAPPRTGIRRNAASGTVATARGAVARPSAPPPSQPGAALRPPRLGPPVPGTRLPSVAPDEATLRDALGPDTRRSGFRKLEQRNLNRLLNQVVSDEVTADLSKDPRAE